MIQWLGLWAFTAMVLGSIPDWGAKIPQAAQHGKRKSWKPSCENETLYPKYTLHSPLPQASGNHHSTFYMNLATLNPSYEWSHAVFVLLWLANITYWRRVWQPTPVFLPGEFHGQRSVACCRPRDRKEWDTTERLTDAHAAYTAFRVHHVAACVRIPFVCEAAYYSIVGMYYSLFIRLYIIHLCIVCWWSFRLLLSAFGCHECTALNLDVHICSCPLVQFF